MWANAVLYLHAAFVLFVVGGLLAIWIGAARGYRWSADPWFRGAHLAAIAIVIGEAWLGIPCPLTVLEDSLRGTPSAQGFIARWVDDLLFWNLPTWFFTVMYSAFGVSVAWTWIRFPPRWRR
jgi:Protein of Unknown function (DUF2784)